MAWIEAAVPGSRYQQRYNYITFSLRPKGNRKGVTVDVELSIPSALFGDFLPQWQNARTSAFFGTLKDHGLLKVMVSSYGRKTKSYKHKILVSLAATSMLRPPKPVSVAAKNDLFTLSDSGSEFLAVIPGELMQYATAYYRSLR